MTLYQVVCVSIIAGALLWKVSDKSTIPDGKAFPAPPQQPTFNPTALSGVVAAIGSKPIFPVQTDPAQQSATKPDLPLADVALQGVVRAGERKALLSVRGEKPVWLHEGEDLQGLTLVRISQTAVTLRGGGQEGELRLFGGAPNAAATAPNSPPKSPSAPRTESDLAFGAVPGSLGRPTQ